MICWTAFDSESLVTPLPCDIRHYFHTDCIEQWLVINACCPVCRSPVTLEEIERVAMMYQGKLDLHEKCCSDHNRHLRRSQSESSGVYSKTCSSHNEGSNFYNQTLEHFSSDGHNRSFKSSNRSLQGKKLGMVYCHDPSELEMGL